MISTKHRRLALCTNVELDVWTAGQPNAPPIIFLHGFPESHRAWRFQIEEFARDHFVIAPDQRGYARSSKPQGVENYSVGKQLADIIALADAFDIDRFTLVGHDFGGAMSWAAALLRPERIERLVIINAPHPYIFPRTLIENIEQRTASQYINRYREPVIEAELSDEGRSKLFDTIFIKHFGKTLDEAEKSAYLDEWSQPGAMTAMLGWYRAIRLAVPQPGEEASSVAIPCSRFAPLAMPTLVLWGMNDKVLLPCQLDGLDEVINDLTVLRLFDCGHFAPWEKPAAVNHAMRQWFATHPRPVVPS